MPYFVLLFSLIFYGLSTTLQKKAMEDIGLGAMMKIHGWAVGGMYLLAWYFYAETLKPYNYLFPFLAALSSVGGFIFYYEALKSTAASIVSVLTSMYSLVVVFLAIFILHEEFLPIYGAGLALIIVGLFLLKEKKSSKKSTLGIVLSFCAMLLWGLWGFFSKLSHNYVGEAEIMGAFGLIAMLILPMYGKRYKQDIGSPKGEVLGLVSVVILSAASVLFYFSLRFFPVSVSIPIISGYPMATIISSYFILHERLTKKQLFASVLIIAGIILFFI